MTDELRPATDPGPSAVTVDPWGRLAAFTPARLALGRAGSGLPTTAVLALALAHAAARDAVHASFDAAPLAAWCEAAGLRWLAVESAAANREIYLRRPDLGRRLSARARDALAQSDPAQSDISIVLADGLSATALAENGQALLESLVPALRARGLTLAPVCLAHQSRVALGDEVGEILGARMSIMLIGERPGLSAADSLGAYLTFAPRLGRTDAERNCVSNIRAAGLPSPQATAKITWLVDQALSLSLTGVGLKDDSGRALLLENERLDR